jgi:hypothetical protein
MTGRTALTLALPEPSFVTHSAEQEEPSWN